MNEPPKKPVDDTSSNPAATPQVKRCCGGWAKILLAVLAVGAALMVLSTWSSCSSYETAWQEQVQAPEDDLLAGKWEGTWQSGDDQEKLSAVIRKQEEDKYVADILAETPAYVPFDDYTQGVVFHVEKGLDRWTFSGSANKGWKGGTYKFEGWTDGETFYSTFTSFMYSGTYTMKRVEKPVQ